MKDIFKSIFATFLIMGIFAIIISSLVFLILHINGIEIKTEKEETIKTKIIHLSKDPLTSIIVDDDTCIVYIKYNKGISPYLGEHGRPCKLDNQGKIQEITAEEIYKTE